MILNAVRDALTDPGKTTFPDLVLLEYLNQSLLMLTIARPDATSIVDVITLAAGSEQSLPARGLRLLSVFGNVSGSSLIGPSVRSVERSSLDDVMGSWLTETADTKCYEYWYDEKNPTKFWTNPVSAGTKIKASFSASPDVLTDVDDAVPVDDSYSSALQEFMLYLAWRRDDEISPNYQRALAHRQACFDLLGIKAGADVSSSPKPRAGG